MSAWFLLFLTIALEVAGTIAMKHSQGLSRLYPTLMIYFFYGLCFSIFSLVVKKMELSVAYAIWSGAGTLAVSVIGFLYFHETFTLLKAISIILIILGVIGLKLSSASI
ncbi:DMT family transporter [Bacillota bacterium Lsc_1132]